MARPITLCTSQWLDLPLETLAQKVSQWGYDGLELSCGGDHFEVQKALESDAYIRQKHDLLEKYGLKCFSISNHLIGQCVCDPIDERHKSILPPRIWKDGDPEGIRQRAAEEMKDTARAARRLGVDVVNGFTGSSIWDKLYFFPPTGMDTIDAGYQDFADRWRPILDVFQAEEVRFALEVHPTEIAYDIHTFHRALEAVQGHPSFGINFDPSHLVHQFISPVAFLHEFADRIYHVHVKDVKVRLDGRSSILSSHLAFGDPRRGWDFVSPGHGDIRWDELIRTLNDIQYAGPLSIEWEDSGMERDWGAQDAIQTIQKLNFSPSTQAFDAAFATYSQE
ncbi:MAG: TIM barrel protein [Chloroflexi bacterium]|nr:sugar phosphate isomerase/epimerase family protein [Anaerolineaceae bacterium]NMB88818.1 TIM barrel protein [Chloroflexota bacterium]